MNLLKGCEIEAIGINYSVETQQHETQQQKHYLFHLFNKKNTKAFPIQQHQTEPATPTASRRRKVLSDVNCKANPWEILAIVGPSGAGKSTLLEILAGKITPDQGSIMVNGSPATKKLAHQFRKISGYVTQHDTLFPLLTVEETLLFTARLRLGLPATELRSRVNSLLDELGLAHVAGSRVGGSGCSGGRVRGISGGERRRVSIGVEVVHEPKVLILDEPTSGLDSSSALQIVDMLKSMAETKGRTIILTIHQPGFRIVKLFSSVLILAGGMVLEQGTLDQLGFRLRAMGLEMPPRLNMVEFAIDSIDKIVQFRQQSLQKVDDCDDDGHYVENSEVQLQQQHVMILQHHQQQQSQNQRKRRTLQQLFQQSKVAVDEGITTIEMIEKAIETTPTTAGDGVNFPHEYANSRWKETVILSHRFAKIVFRTKELFACRTLQMLISGLILGSIFYHLRDDLVGAMERAGLFAFILTFLLSCTTEALPIFLQEREILMKETSSGSYRVSSYVIANSIVYLPFLLILAALFSVPVYWLVGLNRTFMAFAHFLLLIWLILYTANSVVVCFSALVPNFIVGNSVISGVMGGFFLFSGYFISKDEIPGYWIGMHYVSLFKYPYEGFLINEFVKSSGGNTNGSSHYGCLERVFGACVVTGKDVLKEEGIREEDVSSGRWMNVLFMLCFIVLYRFISYVVLRWRCSHRSLKVSLA